MQDVEGLIALRNAIVDDSAANMGKLATWDALHTGEPPCTVEQCFPCVPYLELPCDMECSLPYVGCSDFRVIIVALGRCRRGTLFRTGVCNWGEGSTL